MLEKHVTKWKGLGCKAHIEIRNVGDLWFAKVIVNDLRRDISWHSYETDLHESIEAALLDLKNLVRDDE